MSLMNNHSNAENVTDYEESNCNEEFDLPDFLNSDQNCNVLSTDINNGNKRFNSSETLIERSNVFSKKRTVTSDTTSKNEFFNFSSEKTRTEDKITQINLASGESCIIKETVTTTNRIDVSYYKFNSYDNACFNASTPTDNTFDYQSNNEAVGEVESNEEIYRPLSSDFSDFWNSDSNFEVSSKESSKISNDTCFNKTVFPRNTFDTEPNNTYYEPLIETYRNYKGNVNLDNFHLDSFNKDGEENYKKINTNDMSITRNARHDIQKQECGMTSKSNNENFVNVPRHKVKTGLDRKSTSKTESPKTPEFDFMRLKLREKIPLSKSAEENSMIKTPIFELADKTFKSKNISSIQECEPKIDEIANNPIKRKTRRFEKKTWLEKNLGKSKLFKQKSILPTKNCGNERYNNKFRCNMKQGENNQESLYSKTNDSRQLRTRNMNKVNSCEGTLKTENIKVKYLHKNHIYDRQLEIKKSNKLNDNQVLKTKCNKTENLSEVGDNKNKSFDRRLRLMQRNRAKQERLNKEIKNQDTNVNKTKENIINNRFKVEATKGKRNKKLNMNGKLTSTRNFCEISDRSKKEPTERDKHKKLRNNYNKAKHSLRKRNSKGIYTKNIINVSKKKNETNSTTNSRHRSSSINSKSASELSDLGYFGSSTCSMDDIKLSSKVSVLLTDFKKTKTNAGGNLGSSVFNPLFDVKLSQTPKVILHDVFKSKKPVGTTLTSDPKLLMTPKVILQDVCRSGKPADVLSTVTERKKRRLRTRARIPSHWKTRAKLFPPKEASDTGDIFSSGEVSGKTKNTSWFEGISFKEAILNQHYNPPDVEEIFGCISRSTVDLSKMFNINKPKYHFRSSSAEWSDTS